MEEGEGESFAAKNNDDIASSYFQTKYGGHMSDNGAKDVNNKKVPMAPPPAPSANKSLSNGVNGKGTPSTPKKSWRSASVGLRGAGRSNTATPDRETRSSSATRGGPMFSYLSLVSPCDNT